MSNSRIQQFTRTFCSAEDRKTPVSVVCRSLQPNDPAVLEARLDSLDDDVTSGLGNSGGFGIHHEQNEGIMTNAFGPSIDHNDQVGRATVKRLDGDDVTRAEAMDVLTTVTSSTERDTRQLGDESVPPSKKQPGRANEGQYNLTMRLKRNADARNRPSI
jgi:hypothetical protein